MPPDFWCDQILDLFNVQPNVWVRAQDLKVSSSRLTSSRLAGIFLPTSNQWLALQRLIECAFTLDECEYIHVYIFRLINAEIYWRFLKKSQPFDFWDCGNTVSMFLFWASFWRFRAVLRKFLQGFPWVGGKQEACLFSIFTPSGLVSPNFAYVGPKFSGVVRFLGQHESVDFRLHGRLVSFNFRFFQTGKHQKKPAKLQLRFGGSTTWFWTWILVQTTHTLMYHMHVSAQLPPSKIPWDMNTNQVSVHH